jgi:cobalt-precorrin-5B (C1)-methyltransferase
LSILGTTGRVRLQRCCIAGFAEMLTVRGGGMRVTSPVLVPGNIGEKAARRNFRLSAEQVIQVSNQWGAMLDETSRYCFAQLLILGHPGKLAKLAEGEWDTHSSNSQSAVPIVAKLAEKLFRKPAATSVTVEGIFQSLTDGQRLELANELSCEICKCIYDGETIPNYQSLINMNGDILGSGGELCHGNKCC